MAQIISKHVLTIGTGKKLYVDMAMNLARSFLRWHPDNDIVFQLVTDLPQFVLDDLKNRIELITIGEGELGLGFSTKLHLDKLVSQGQTLFIDSDCLIFGRLDSLFARFRGHSVSVAGKYISSGEWFGDISSVCRQFNLARIPQFNGGLYYVEKGEKASTVYQNARDLEQRYDEIGFIRLRGRPNDEVLMALAMELNGESPLLDDGTIMSDPQACPADYKVDVISGERILINPDPPHPLHQSWYPFQKVSPLIVHFLGQYTQHYPYKREIYRLRKLAEGRLNTFTEFGAILMIQFPGQIKNHLKNALRPLYRRAFGHRRIAKSDRIV